MLGSHSCFSNFSFSYPDKMDTSPTGYDCTALTSQELYSHLNKVSRSFAVTIPMLPQPLRDHVSLSYLLCRIVDTVEDDDKAELSDRITWLSDMSFLAGEEFSDLSVLERLSERALEITCKSSAADDVALVKDTIRAVALLQTFDEEVRKIICHGVSILSFGMSSSLRRRQAGDRINSLDDVDNYCYFAAGVVGELLSELFAVECGNVDRRSLMELAVSFGEGLQLTNILRDRAKDSLRGVHFMPAAYDGDSVLEYVAITQGHLDDAVEFICTLPAKKCRGIRQFCLTNVMMARYILRQIAAKPLDPDCNYRISRLCAGRIFMLCRLCAGSDTGVRILNLMLSFGMKKQHRNARQLRDRVSIWDHSAGTN